MAEAEPSEGLKSPLISNVCVMGGTGFLGRALAESLRADGANVTVYSRGARGPGIAHWSPLSGEIDVGPLEKADVVVNLSGEGLASGRWTDLRKQRFRDSRITVTRMLSERLATLDTPPAVLINASAVGFYGDRGETAVTEDSASGEGFLAGLCQAWEEAAAPASEAGIRVVLPRLAILLGRGGGMMERLLPLFRMGAGARLGSGDQYMPWIALQDAVGIMSFIMRHPELSGPINVVAPEPCTNADFTRALSRALSRPALLPAPAFIIRAVLGEMGQELLLSGANARPRALEKAGYRFEYPRLDDALAHILK